MLLLSTLPVLVAAADVMSGLKKHFPELSEHISNYRYAPLTGEMVLQSDMDPSNLSPIFDHMSDNPEEYDIGNVFVGWVAEDLSVEDSRVEGTRELTSADKPGHVQVGNLD